MRERPILFNGAMVRAIRAGQKTQTRRAVKPDGAVEVVRFIGADNQPTGEFGWCRHPSLITRHIRCPFGQPGDRLWVRETWGVINNAWNEAGDIIEWTPDRPSKPVREMRFGRGYYTGNVIYAADGPEEWAGDDDGGGEPKSAWKPSIHMPRWACRLVLEIIAVRVERLQAISEADTKAEGIQPDPVRSINLFGCTNEERAEAHHRAAVRPFRDLWTSPGGDWDSNPWVWVIEFKQVTP